MAEGTSELGGWFSSHDIVKLCSQKECAVLYVVMFMADQMILSNLCGFLTYTVCVLC